jgi:hypothetical protein
VRGERREVEWVVCSLRAYSVMDELRRIRGE